MFAYLEAAATEAATAAKELASQQAEALQLQAKAASEAAAEQVGSLHQAATEQVGSLQQTAKALEQAAIFGEGSSAWFPKDGDDADGPPNTPDDVAHPRAPPSAFRRGLVAVGLPGRPLGTHPAAG